MFVTVSDGTRFFKSPRVGSESDSKEIHAGDKLLNCNSEKWTPVAPVPVRPTAVWINSLISLPASGWLSLMIGFFCVEEMLLLPDLMTFNSATTVRLNLVKSSTGKELEPNGGRSEEHTSELQSRQYLVC